MLTWSSTSIRQRITRRICTARAAPHVPARAVWWFTLLFVDQESQVKRMMKRVTFDGPLIELFSNDKRLANLALFDAEV